MDRAMQEGRWVVDLRPSGFGRWVTAAFLTFWLAGGAVGEAFGLSMLLSGLGGPVASPIGRLPPFPAGLPGAVMLSFVGIWTAFWTVGGLGAASTVLSVVWGLDRIV